MQQHYKSKKTTKTNTKSKKQCKTKRYKQKLTLSENMPHTITKMTNFSMFI